MFLERAESYFKHASQLDPSSAMAQRKYGLFLAEKMNRPAEAELLLLKSLELSCMQSQEVDATALAALVKILDGKVCECVCFFFFSFLFVFLFCLFFRLIKDF